MDGHYDLFHTMVHQKHYYRAALTPSQTQSMMSCQETTCRSKMALVQFAGPNDVICGRGSQANKHIGNVRFRERVKQFQDIYRSSHRSDKPLVALQIVLELKAMSPTGKFLTKPPLAVQHQHSGVVFDPDYWMEVDEVQAVSKVCQRLCDEKVTTFGVASRRRPRGHVPFTTNINNTVETTSQQEESTVSRHESPRSDNDESDTPNVDPAIQSSYFASRRFEPDHGEVAPGDNRVVLDTDGVPTAATLLELLEADF